MSSKNTAILVLGMHRSGTSALAGVLARMGVEFGENLMPPSADNPAGYYEHNEVFHLHEAIFSQLETNWDDPAALPEGWLRDPRIGPSVEQLAAIVRRDFSESALWGLKDPRLCRLLPLWLELLKTLETDVKIIFVARPPNEVSASLHKRDQMSYEQSTMLWLSYTLSAELHSRENPRSIIMYADLLANWQAQIERLQDTLALPPFAFSDSTKTEIASFLSAELHHGRNAPMPVLHAPQNQMAPRVLEMLLEWRRDGNAPVDDFYKALKELQQSERVAAPNIAYAKARERSHAKSVLEAEEKHFAELQMREADLMHMAQARETDLQMAAATQAALRSELAQARSQATIEAHQQAQALAAAQAAFEGEKAASVSARRSADDQAALQARLRLDVVRELRVERERYQRQLTEVNAVLGDMQRSTSWRITKPIRIALKSLRQLLRKRLTVKP